MDLRRNFIVSIVVGGMLIATGASPAGAFSIATVDSTQVFIEPGTPARIIVPVSGANTAGVVDYSIRDYTGKTIATGQAQPAGSDALSIDIRLPRGYYEVVFSNEAVIGIVSLPSHSGEYDTFFGINSVFAVNVRHGRWDKDGIEQAIKILKRSGITSIREMSHWFQAERSKGDIDKLWNYRFTDDIHKLAAKYGLNVVDFEDHYPDWAYVGPKRAGSTHRIPTELFSISQSISTMARRWESSRGGYQVLNELERKPISADESTAVLKFFSWLLKAHNVRTPLVGPGFAPAFRDSEMMRVSFENDLLDTIDVYAYHRYSVPHTALDELEFYRKGMSPYKRGNIPIWISEMGQPWPRGTDRATLEQASNPTYDIVHKSLVYKAGGVDRIFPFTLDFFEENRNNFGMFGKERTPLLQMAGYANCVHMLSNYSYAGEVKGGIKGVSTTQVFANGAEAVVVLDTHGPQARTVGPIDLPVNNVHAIDGSELHLDEGRTLRVVGGIAYLKLPLAHVPVNANTRSMALKLIADSWENQPRETSPVVLQYNAADHPRTYTTYAYLPDTIEVDIWNFDSRPQKVSPQIIAPEGVAVVEGPTGEISLTPRSKTKVAWRLDWSSRTNKGKHDVYVQDASGKASDIMMVFDEVVCPAVKTGKWHDFPAIDQDASPGRFRVDWRLDTMIVSVEVDNPDTQRSPQHEPNFMWRGDGVRMSFQAHNPVYRRVREFTELCVGLSNDQPTIFRHLTADPKRPIGMLKASKAIIMRRNNKTTYVITINNDEVLLGELQSGTKVPFTIMVNYTNADGKLSSLRWGGALKNPFEFYDLVIE